MDCRRLKSTQIRFSPQQVVWAEQQFLKHRVKRDFIPPLDGADVPEPASRFRRADLRVPPQRIERMFNDELWDQEWYLVSHQYHASLWYTHIISSLYNHSRAKTKFLQVKSIFGLNEHLHK